MLNTNQIKTVMIMCKRASCTGEESLEVAQSILALEHMLREAMAVDQATAEIEAKKRETPKPKAKATPKRSRKK